MTIREALGTAVRQLTAAGLRTPRSDAELILTSVMDCERAFLMTYPERPLKPDQEKRFRSWLEKRRNHYPLQYLRGRQEFYGREFLLSPAVLVPRPETEILVEQALDFLKGFDNQVVEVAEVGIGSGCLGLSLVCEDLRVILTGLDVSQPAVAVASLNAQRLGCARRVRLLAGDVLAPLRGLGGHFHLIVSNPPYGRLDDIAAVDWGVRRHEPRRAVFAGPTGLEVFKRIFQQAGDCLRPDGAVLVEIGAGQGPSLIEMAIDNGWKLVRLSQDLAGLDRCALFQAVG